MGLDKTEKIGNVVLDYTYYSGKDLYSEGIAEDRLLDFVRNHDESEYDNYIQISRSWSVMYHLSHVRQNCVSWLPIRENQTVLEVGSGCGAITSAFARVANKVTCVELSKKRSLINAYRNKEYDNIEIKVGNFEEIEPHIEEKYDYITLIGVFEYAASYLSGKDPYERFLDILKKHLKPDGKIVIAIENRLGLKYFAGCKEDHLGNYFSGIMGYNDAAGVRTFSKRSLTKILESQGLNCRFYYPYPDYKLPHTIYSDSKLPSKGELNNNLRNFDGDRIVLFDEEKAFDSFIEEGVFPEYSNSFVVIASLVEGWDKKVITPIFAKYASERLNEYRVNTLIAKAPDGGTKVFKRALSVKANEHIKRLCDNYDRLSEQFGDTGFKPVGVKYIKGVEKGIPICGVSPKAKDVALFDYVSGIGMDSLLQRLESEGQYERMEAIIKEYCRKLYSLADIVDFKKSAKFDEVFGKREFTKDYKAVNPCNLDMIFSNIIVDSEKEESGDWIVLDYEWVFEFAIPIQFIIYRTLFYQFGNRTDDGFSLYLSRKGLDIYSLCDIDNAERLLFEEMEHAYQVYIIGGAASLDVMRVLMPTATMSVDQLIKDASYLKNLDTPKIYFGHSKNFTEDNQITQIGKVENNEVTFKVDIDRFITSIRVDPTEYPCIVHINSICYILNDGTRADVDTLLINGYPLTDRSYLFDTNDPQMIIEDVTGDVKSVEMKYIVTMPNKVFYDEYLEYVRVQEIREATRKQAFSYRLKRKLKIIKEDILPEGYKKVRILFD